MKNSFSIKGNLKAINHLAWGAMRKHGLSWGDAFRHAIRAIKLRNELSSGIIEFSFTKLDGSIRPAKGTRDLAAIPADKHPKGTSTKPETTNVVTYYDLDANNWRSFDIANLIPA